MNSQAATIQDTSTIYYKETGVIWRLSNFFLEQIPFDHPNLSILLYWYRPFYR